MGYCCDMVKIKPELAFPMHFRIVYVEIIFVNFYFWFKHEGVCHSIFKFQQCRAGKSTPSIYSGICYLEAFV